MGVVVATSDGLMMTGPLSGSSGALNQKWVKADTALCRMEECSAVTVGARFIDFEVVEG